ncbi:PepSY domain-containing protein [Sphingomonas sp.]|uniref:PepSY domain-containing protein n=1 Tax=Sphingomonas sp. TaxID=28214 RepID=UPI001EC9CA6D|nr:PepSY domain-containing protein [Sphingomonas sp.]MBX3593318.1 PepSY domain-containing protein [Sphingomonas sp.]
MNPIARALRLPAPLLLLSLLTVQPARADGDVTCGGGPQSGWQDIAKLKKAVWLERWEVLKVQVEGDCYEVYARTEQGQAIEAFFHPVTLRKLVVFRRGREIYRAKGFTG